MACYHPVQAWRDGNGSVKFVERGDVRATMSLPCGRCIGCRIAYAAMWEVRIMHESKCHDRNCFVTLTYADDKVPSDGSLRYSDFQRFMKRVRKEFSVPVRFFVAGEYGDALGRPHFHVALFGIDFREDRKRWRKSETGFNVDRSETLERLWPFGHSEIGDLSPQSANYIARYVIKKVNGDRADEHYKAVDLETGEVYWKVPEFCHMSLKPGIGAKWFEKFGEDVFPEDRVIARGVRKRVPRYYDKLLKRLSPEMLDDVKAAREFRARLRAADNTDARLAVREQVDEARLRYYKRGLK